MTALTKWLLEGPAWVQYRTRRDLLDQSEKDPQVRAARDAMLGHAQIKSLLKGLADWPGSVLSGHKSAGHPLHTLTFIADVGIRAEDPGINKIVARILKHQSPDGPFQVLMNIPEHFGGSGKDEPAWALCDAPLVLYALIKLGLGGDPRVQTGIEYLAGLVRENGWPCAVSPELGKFRGPGRKDDPCPYATLVMLKVLAQVPKMRNSKAAHVGAEALLSAWEQRRASHPYMFYTGTDFCKLKAPLVWYDLMHVLDILTQFSWLRKDSRLQAMGKILSAKADGQGRFIPESIWTAWKDWDFGQKKKPSEWLTLLAQRILKRMGA